MVTRGDVAQGPNPVTAGAPLGVGQDLALLVQVDAQLLHMLGVGIGVPADGHQDQISFDRSRLALVVGWLVVDLNAPIRGQTVPPRATGMGNDLNALAFQLTGHDLAGPPTPVGEHPVSPDHQGHLAAGLIPNGGEFQGHRT